MSNLKFLHKGKGYHIYDSNGDSLTISLSDGKPAEKYLEAISRIKYKKTTCLTRDVFEAAIFNAKSIVGSEENRNVNDVLKLHFLKETIFILLETEKKFIDNPHLLEDLIGLYWKTYSSAVSVQLDVPPEIAIDTCERYLDLCMTDANQDWFNRQKNPNRGDERGQDNRQNRLNREEEIIKVADVLMELNEKEEMTLKETEEARKVEEVKRRIVHMDQMLEHAKQWLISRYNLHKARKINQQGVQFEKYLEIFSFLILILVCFNPLLTYLLSPMMDILSSPLMSLLERYEIHPPVLSKEDISRIAVASFYLIGCIPIASILLDLFDKSKPADLQIHLPRMAAGIVVGYFLLLNDVVWAAVFTEKTVFCFFSPEFNISGLIWMILGLAGIPLFAVYLYILVEMNSVLGIKYPLTRKACRLWRRGWAYSIIIGVVFSDLFGKSVVDRLSSNESFHLSGQIQGLFGYIYPEAVCYLAPIALFIGIFVQLLWQDKALTEKI